MMNHTSHIIKTATPGITATNSVALPSHVLVFLADQFFGVTLVTMNF